MCVAALIDTPSGPSLDDLNSMELHNPHGAGLAWADGDTIRYAKGLDAATVHAILKTIPRPALLHFRWATHGPKVPHLSHPFPLGTKALTSKDIEGTAPAVLIHNGVWRDYLKHIPRGVSAQRTSDTAVAAYVAGRVDESILDHVGWSTAVGRAAGLGRMDVTLRGNWEEYEGNLYSNLHWSYHSWSGYGSYATPKEPKITIRETSAYETHRRTGLLDDVYDEVQRGLWSVDK